MVTVEGAGVGVHVNTDESCRSGVAKKAFRFVCREPVGENRASPWNRSIRRTIGNSVSDSWAGRLFHLGNVMIYVTDFVFLETDCMLAVL